MKRKTKLLLIAIPLNVILLGAVIYQYGILNIREQMSFVDEMQASKMQTLQKYADAIAQKANLEKQVVSLKEKRKNEDTKIIVAQTPASAAASLQNLVKGIIAGRGGTINSERVERPEDLGKFKVINVVVDVVFPDIRALSDTLFAIETQTPYLVVKELDVRVRNYADPRDLLVKLKVSGLTGG
ncbi:MAG TPA: type II secretion system protein GspM [Syntrophales bacterium]|nr:type II secretion system protein GspM [Syntrophales bacterium]